MHRNADPDSAADRDDERSLGPEDAALPSMLTEEQFRAARESTPTDGERLSDIGDASALARVQADSIVRGLHSIDESRRSGEFVDAADLIASLQRKLDAARARAAQTHKGETDGRTD